MNNYTDKKLFGEDIAFGIQQTLACWTTDFIDPFVSAWVQKRLGDKNQNGTLAHAMKGEVLGDSAAFFIFLAMQKWLPAPVHWLRHTALRRFDTVYDTMAKPGMDAWADKNNVSRDSEQYRHKLEEYKQFQASNFAKSAVISLGSIISNVAVQKWSGNKNPIAAITISKGIGAGITMCVMLGSRLAFPQATRRLDKEMDRRFIAPLIHKTRKLLGAENAERGDDVRISYIRAVNEEKKQTIAKER